MSERNDTDETATADEGGGLDPREAATLLEQTKRQAQRQFDLAPPLLTLIRAAVILLGYGAVWWSVRDQHPYQGPNAAALAGELRRVRMSDVATESGLSRATVSLVLRDSPQIPRVVLEPRLHVHASSTTRDRRPQDRGEGRS
jgi:hypothetical protein